MLDPESVRHMKVTELRGELQKLGLPTTGRKEELQARLLEAIDKDSGERGTIRSPSEPGTQSALTGVRPLAVPAGVSTSKSPTFPVNGATGSVPVSAPSAPSPTAATTATTTSASRLSERAARFNLPPTEEDRRRQRQERFGAVDPGSAPTQKSLALASKRLGVSAEDREAVLAEERLRARQERFGIVSHSRLETIEAAAQTIRRQERFGNSGDDGSSK